MISDGGFNIGLRLVSPNRFQYVSIRFEIDGPRIWMMTGCSPILGNIHIRGNKKGSKISWWYGEASIMVIWALMVWFFQDDHGWSMLIEANTQAVFWIMGVSQWVNTYRYGMCSGDASAFLGAISYWEGIGNHVQSQPRISRLLLNQW